MHAKPKHNTVIIDYGMGNLRSVLNKVHEADPTACISNDPGIIDDAEKLILPGVGHFAKGMENLKQSGLLPLLNRKVLIEGTPILGICLGMQLFSSHSEEGNVPGLGWLKANTKRFKEAENIKVPHMGWNTLSIVRDSVVVSNVPQDEQFYFCHSYFFEAQDPADVVSTTEYGTEFISAVQHDNIHGVQFHPEKSHEWGARLIADFVKAA